MVLEHYESSPKKPASSAHNAVYCPLGIWDGLTEHLRFLTSTVEIRIFALYLWNKDQRLTRLVTSLLGGQPHGIAHVKISLDSIEQHHVDLISACKTKNLWIIRAGHIDNGFYQQPVIRQLRSLDDMSTDDSMNDNDLLDLSASFIVIHNKKRITTTGFLSWIEEWATSERDIEFIRLVVETSWSDELYRTLLEQLNETIMAVSDIEIIPESSGCKANITRKLDKKEIIFEWTKNLMTLEQRVVRL